MLLSDHVCCVAITFKTTEWVEQRICIKFCVKLEHSSMESIQIIQKDTAMGNQWLAASPWQGACSCITSHAGFWRNIRSPRWLSHLQPKFGTLQLLAFPKTKITFEKEEISEHRWDSGKYRWGKWWQLGEVGEVPRCLLWSGLRCQLSYVQCFLCLLQ